LLGGIFSAKSFLALEQDEDVEFRLNEAVPVDDSSQGR